MARCHFFDDNFFVQVIVQGKGGVVIGRFDTIRLTQSGSGDVHYVVDPKLIGFLSRSKPR